MNKIHVAAKTVCIYFKQAMVDVVAENYHNIWAKKKRIELGRGKT